VASDTLPFSPVRIRWMIRRDMADVIAIEQTSFEFPWSEADFIRALRERNCIGLVAEQDNKIVGYVIYELAPAELHVLNLAVAPGARRRAVGTKLVEKLVGKLSFQRRERILLEVRETNLAAQLFFKEQGFRAVSVLRDFYDDTVEDAYLMNYRYVPTAEEVDWTFNQITRKAA